MRDIGYILNVYMFGELQDLVKLWQRLDEHSITREELYRYVEEKKKELLKAARDEAEEKIRLEGDYKKYAKKCPQCGEPMRIGDAGDGDSHWWCKSCAVGIYSQLSVREELKRIFNARV